MLHRKISLLSTFVQRQKDIAEQKKNFVNNRMNQYYLNFHATRELNVDIITGVGSRCDWYIKNSVIRKNTDTSEPKTIFLVSDNYKNHINFVENILPTLTKKFILIVGGQDFTWPLGKLDNEYNVKFNSPEWHKRIDTLINSDKILKIFVENLDMEHPKLTPLSLGLSFAKLDDYYLSILNRKIEIDIDNKDIDVLCQHNVHPSHNNDKKSWHYKQFDDRINFNELIKKAPLNKIVSYKEPANKNICGDSVELNDFKDNVLRSNFVVCIHGGGLDPSTKAWECMLLGAIPIIEKSTVSPAYENLPCVIVDKIDEKTLTKDNLDKWWDQYESFHSNKNKRRELLYKLSDRYWWDYINSFLD